MTFRLTRQLPDNPWHRAQPLAPPTTLGQTLGAAFSFPSVTQLMQRQAEIQPPSDRRILPISPLDILLPQEQEEPDDLVPAEELNAAHQGLGLKFDRPMSQAVVDVLVEQKRAELVRESIMARGPGGVGSMGLQFGAMLLKTAIDPLELATVFIPVVGEARAAGLIARFGAVRGRAAVGVVEGFAGNLMLEPLYMGLSRQQQLDYGMGDALVNVFLGAALGGAVGGGIGAARRFRGGITEPSAPVNVEAPRLLPAPERMETGLSPTTRQVDPKITARISELESRINAREVRKPQVRKQIEDIQGRIERAKTEPSKEKLRRRLGRLNLELSTLEADNAVARSEVNRLREDQGPQDVPSTESQVSLAESADAVRMAVAQVAQGKSVKVADNLQEVGRLRNRERLARGRLTQVQKELERVQAERQAERTSKGQASLDARIEDLSGRQTRFAQQHQEVLTELQRAQGDTAKRIAQDEGLPERQATFDRPAMEQVDEAAQIPEIDETALQAEVASARQQIDQAKELGELSEAEVAKVLDEVKALEERSAASERIVRFMQTCLSR